MPTADFEFFSRPDVLLVLTTAPTGFGHLRVTRALQDALPKNLPVHLVGVHDPSSEFLYSLISRYPPLHYLSESIQNHSLFEDFYSLLYRRYLNYSSKHTYDIFARLIKTQPVPPQTVVVVATHFSLAHQISHCKTSLEQDFHLRLILTVVVTDDSPQHIWGIPGADYIFVPSQTTQTRLQNFLKDITPHPPQVLVSAYPIAPILAQPLSSKELSSRRHQVDPQHSELTHLVIPVSGAAVQLPYLRDLIKALVSDPRMSLTVISRESSYCNPFLSWCKKLPRLEILSSPDDQQVVKLYEQAYADHVYALEVTKPSEQAFKALLPPTTRGGVLLLLSPPVGRQEIDNLHFLHRHHLLPDSDAGISPNFSSIAPLWRAIRLPAAGSPAGQAILNHLKSGLFLSMLRFSGYLPHPELQPDGAQTFWSTLSQLITSRNN